MGNRFSVKKRKFQKISPSLCTPKFQLQKVSIETLWTVYGSHSSGGCFCRKGRRARWDRHKSHRYCEVATQLVLNVGIVQLYAPWTRVLGRSWVHSRCYQLSGSKKLKSTVKLQECTFLSFLFPSQLLVCVETVLCSYLKDDFFLQPSTNLLTSN